MRLPHKLPGMHYSANEQCQILFGTNATFCRNMEVSCLGRGGLAREGSSGFCWWIQVFTLHIHTHMYIHVYAYMCAWSTQRESHMHAHILSHIGRRVQGGGSELRLTLRA